MRYICDIILTTIFSLVHVQRTGVREERLSDAKNKFATRLRKVSRLPQSRGAAFRCNSGKTTFDVSVQFKRSDVVDIRLGIKHIFNPDFVFLFWARRVTDSYVSVF